MHIHTNDICIYMHTTHGSEIQLKYKYKAIWIKVKYNKSTNGIQKIYK